MKRFQLPPQLRRALRPLHYLLWTVTLLVVFGWLSSIMRACHSHRVPAAFERTEAVR